MSFWKIFKAAPIKANEAKTPTVAKSGVRPEVRKALAASWKRNERGYRALAD